MQIPPRDFSFFPNRKSFAAPTPRTRRAAGGCSSRKAAKKVLPDAYRAGQAEGSNCAVRTVRPGKRLGRMVVVSFDGRCFRGHSWPLPL